MFVPRATLSRTVWEAQFQTACGQSHPVHVTDIEMLEKSITFLGVLPVRNSTSRTSSIDVMEHRRGCCSKYSLRITEPPQLL